MFNFILMMVKNTLIQPIWKSLSFQKRLKAKTVTQLHQEATVNVQNSAHFKLPQDRHSQHSTATLGSSKAANKDKGK